MNEKIINEIVWWIPIKKLRNNIRNYLLNECKYKNEIKEYIIKNNKELNEIKEYIKYLNKDPFNNNIGYDFNKAINGWSNPPVDDIGYLPSKEILNKDYNYIKEFVNKFENTRYSLDGWRNENNKWRDYLGLDNTNNKHIIDFGCGYGIEALQFLKKGNKVSIADISQDNLNAAEKIINVMGYKIEQKILVSNDYPFFSSNKVDIFYSNGVLHHTPKIIEILSRATDILNDNGEIRLMLYSDKAWTIKTNSKLPSIYEDVRLNENFNLFVKRMDGVGKYANWFNEEKIQYLISKINEKLVNKTKLILDSYKYICKEDIYCVVIIKRAEQRQIKIDIICIIIKENKKNYNLFNNLKLVA